MSPSSSATPDPHRHPTIARPLIANVVSSFPPGLLTGSWFTGASLTASMVIVVVLVFCPWPAGTFCEPSLTVHVTVRVVLFP